MNRLLAIPMVLASVCTVAAAADPAPARPVAANGNYLVSHIRGAQEVTPDKKVVWQVEDHARFAGLANGHLVDVPGDAAKGELLH